MEGSSSPSSLKYNPITVRNEYGNSSRPWQMMLLGWESMLVEGPVNWITYDSSEHVTNISYTGAIGSMNADGDNYVLIGHEFYQQPDRFTVLPGQPGANASKALTEYPTYEDNASGEWYYNNETATNITEMVYILSDKGGAGSFGWKRKKRGAPAEIGISPDQGWASVDFKVF